MKIKFVCDSNFRQEYFIVEISRFSFYGVRRISLHFFTPDSFRRFSIFTPYFYCSEEDDSTFIAEIDSYSDFIELLKEVDVINMKVGKYQIGRYHGIVKKIYEDGTYDYETRFSDKNDFMQSVRVISFLLGDYVGLANPNPKKLVSYQLFIGKDKIIKELTKQ